jgi:hypothetical protein
VGILDGTASAHFADFLNRSRQDLLVVRTGGPLLFSNLGNGRFEPRPDAFQFARPPQGTFTSVAAVDYNRDGLLDIYLCVYSYYQGLNQYQFPSPYYDAQNGPSNFLFRNRGDGTFEDVTTASGMDQIAVRLGVRGATGKAPVRSLREGFVSYWTRGRPGSV